ncbi:MAG: site-specific DNA-methyltransferase [Xanthobacteraceae bacterium]
MRRVLRDDGTLWLNLGDSYSAGGRGGGGKQDTNMGSIGLGPWKVKGYAQKQLLGIPWRVALALQADGWYLRSDIIWAKPNVMPESVSDRPTKAHEYLFLFAKSPTYYYDADAIREPLAAASIARAKYSWRSEKANASVKGRTTGIPVEEMAGRFANPKGRNKRTVWSVTTSVSRMKHMAMFPEKLIEPCILAGAPLNALVLDPFLGSGTTAAVAKRLGRHYVGIELNPAYVRLARERLSRVQLGLAA